MIRPFPILIALLLSTGVAGQARAAQGYDNCTGFIDSLPATIATQGTWCLRKDLVTSVTSGTAITVGTNNVTIDCGHFKLNGLAAGVATLAVGIRGDERQNISVRRCTVRGFAHGLVLDGTANAGGHVVEDNRFDHNTARGLAVAGSGSVVRRNLVLDTGGATPSMYRGLAIGIYAAWGVDVVDNTIAGATPGISSAGLGKAYGIHLKSNTGGNVSGNRIRGLVPRGASGSTIGVFVESGGQQRFVRNEIIGDRAALSKAFHCGGNYLRVEDNVVIDYAALSHNCQLGTNTYLPPAL